MGGGSASLWMSGGAQMWLWKNSTVTQMLSSWVSPCAFPAYPGSFINKKIDCCLHSPEGWCQGGCWADQMCCAEAGDPVSQVCPPHHRWFEPLPPQHGSAQLPPVRHLQNVWRLHHWSVLQQHTQGLQEFTHAKPRKVSPQPHSAAVSLPSEVEEQQAHLLADQGVVLGCHWDPRRLLPLHRLD